MNPGNYHRVRQAYRGGMRLDALCRAYNIDRKELNVILSGVPRRPNNHGGRHPAFELIDEGHTILQIENAFALTDLERAALSQYADSLPSSPPQTGHSTTV